MPEKRKPTRRGNGEGTIYQRSDGKWCGQVLLGYSPKTGKAIRKTLYGKTRTSVSSKVSQLTGQVFAGIAPADTGTITLEAFLKAYLWDFKCPEVANSTFSWYLDIAESYIFPMLGKFMLKDITPTLVQRRLINALTDKQLSHRTIKAARNLMNQLFKHAVDTRALAYNPITPTRLPRNNNCYGDLSGKQVKVIPSDERTGILEAAKSDPRMKLALTVLIMTGMRTGEFLGLRLKDIDFANNTIFIQNAITTETTYSEDREPIKRKTVIGSTKTTGSVRKIPVTPEVMNVISEWRDGLPAYVFKTCKVDVLSPDAILFPTKQGALRTYNGFRTTYRRFMEQHELTPYPLHTYRHTFATILLEQNVNPKIIQELLGHRDIETTLNIYSHVLPETLTGVASLLSDVYKNMSLD